jgi:hypothetical protein
MRTRSLFQTTVLLLCPAFFLLTQSAYPGSSIPPILFVSRNPLSGANPGDVPGIGPRWRTAVTGGRLLVRNAKGTVTTLVGPDRLFDVADPCVSWDGKRIVFAGVEHRDSCWRIFEVGVNGGGFRKVTQSDRRLALLQFGAAAEHFTRYDDFDPCYLPDGRIVFSSTRYPALAGTGQVLVSNLFVVRSEGTGMHRITTERNSAEEPCVDPLTGRIVYSRWWLNVDRPSNITRAGLSRDPSSALTADVGNLWQAVTVRPDGDELKLFAGFPRTRTGVHAYKPSFMTDGRLLTTFILDLLPVPESWGTAIRLFRRGPGVPRSIIGTKEGSPPFALEAAEIDRETIVCSYSADGMDYGIFRCRLDGGGLRSLIDLPGTLEMDPQPVRARHAPPVLEDGCLHEPLPLPPTEDPQTHSRDDFFRFDCMNIFANAGVDVPILDAPRITRNARIRFFMNVQRQNPHEPDPSILLKDAAVMVHGGVHEHDVPAEVPLFEQVVDSTGKVLGTTDGKFAHVAGFNFERQGAGTKCVGCHAGHSMMDVPINGLQAAWFNLAPSAAATASTFYTASNGEEFSPDRLVDRQARTGGDTVLWVAAEREHASASLRWELPVELREFVLYGLPRGVRSGTVSVEDCKITLYSGARPVRTIQSTGRIREGGTRVSFVPALADRADIVIKASRGTIDNHALTGLAEIEAIGRIPEPEAGMDAGRR